VTGDLDNGVSRSGASQVAGAAIVKHLRPDSVGHISGGPIPMPEGDMAAIVTETDLFLELCSSGNPRTALRLMDLVKARRAFHRVVIGTDTPGGTGVIPRGTLHQIAFLSAVGEVAPEVAIAMATGNVARAHGLQIGILEEGKPADLVLLDRVQGSIAKDVMDSFALGDLPGISLVMIDGEIRVAGRSQQTPPPERTALIAGGG
jgi:cytosine/adenosine deaminase-related metal-dependent hydrolase